MAKQTRFPEFTIHAGEDLEIDLGGGKSHGYLTLEIGAGRRPNITIFLDDANLQHIIHDLRDVADRLERM